ncbi:MAG TPA: ABC transporter ATP-binding protein, partial [Candidatus Saccharimonadales bacterium]|nr:ABC transporter ATP-binding protein [Candidatus Saccharimonadales bacterium]
MKTTDSKAVNIDRVTIVTFWRASLRNKRLFWRSLLFPLGTVCSGTLAPLYIGKILASLGRPGIDATHYVPYFVAAAGAGFLANRIGVTANLALQAQAMRHLQRRAFNMLLNRSVGFHNNNVGGKLVSDAIDYPNGYGVLVNALYTQLVPLAITLLTGVAVIFLESWILGVVILLMTVICIGSGVYESQRRSSLRKARLVITKKLTGHLADSIVNVQTIKTFAHEPQELARHDTHADKLMHMRLRDWGRAGINGSYRIGALVVTQLLFILVVIWLVQRDPGLLGIGIFAFSFTITLSNRLFDLNQMIRNIEDGLLLASPMTEYMLQTPEITDRPGAGALNVSKGEIALQNVRFRYQDGNTDQTVFSGLELRIAPGEKVGLVGPSGGGKSTLTRLLLRFEDIESGRICIDGQDISEVTQASLRKAISYVPQEPLLFHRPVSENIAYGQAHADLAAIAKAARAAHADEFIRDLPKGYDTVVGERGVKLSGGQRQRIAIARAILKDAPILVLDEATSALDSESEVLIQDALWKLMEHRTAIVIAHRLSTIQ